LNLNEDTKSISANIREWLGLAVPYDFRDIRDAVEQKGIMVIVSNAYNGKWQIDKKNPVRGFSLYYDVLPIIVIKKQTSSGAQTFTLMHEFAHLLLHRESAIDNDEDFYNCCKNTNARGIVIVSYHSYLIIDLIRYLFYYCIYSFVILS
jgi:Zn-dependent peptidase ImmA (M78 family)